MRTFTIEVTEAIAERWDRLARASQLPTEVWMTFCLHTCEQLEFPVTQLIWRIPPADRREAGIYWEVSRFGRPSEQDPRSQAHTKNRSQQLEQVADHRRRLHAFAEDLMA